MTPVRFITALILCAATLATHAQTSNTSNIKDDLFVGTEKFAKGASDIEEITMDHDSLTKVGGQASGMVLNVVRTYSYPKPGMYNIADVEEFRNKINTGDWHCSVHISHPLKGESTDVCERHRTDNMHESAIITVEPKELTFIHKITRDRTGNQSWNSYSDDYFVGGHSSAEMQALIEVSMAEARASLAGLNYGLSSGSYTVPPNARLLERRSADEARKIADQVRRSSDAATPPAPAPPKAADPEKQ